MPIEKKGREHMDFFEVWGRLEAVLVTKSPNVRKAVEEVMQTSSAAHVVLRQYAGFSKLNKDLKEAHVEPRLFVADYSVLPRREESGRLNSGKLDRLVNSLIEKRVTVLTINRKNGQPPPFSSNVNVTPTSSGLNTPTKTALYEALLRRVTKMPKALIFYGESGAGKTTESRDVLKNDPHSVNIRTWTDRMQRATEKADSDRLQEYNFVEKGYFPPLADGEEFRRFRGAEGEDFLLYEHVGSSYAVDLNDIRHALTDGHDAVLVANPKIRKPLEELFRDDHIGIRVAAASDKDETMHRLNDRLARRYSQSRDVDPKSAEAALSDYQTREAEIRRQVERFWSMPDFTYTLLTSERSGSYRCQAELSSMLEAIRETEHRLSTHPADPVSYHDHYVRSALGAVFSSLPTEGTTLFIPESNGLNIVSRGVVEAARVVNVEFTEGSSMRIYLKEPEESAAMRVDPDHQQQIVLDHVETTLTDLGYAVFREGSNGASRLVVSLTDHLMKPGKGMLIKAKIMYR